MENKDKTYLPQIFKDLKEDELKDVIEKAKDWALMHGACMRSRTNFSKDSLQFAPFILTPSPFPRREFTKAVEIQVILNELMHKVAHNSDFLRSSLKATIQVDEFTANLFKIYETIQQEGVAQRVSLGLLRSDYMIHRNAANVVKQVELNTIASSFGAISHHVSLLYRYVLQELGHADKLKNLPENTALQGLCDGMIQAWKLYNNPQAVVLFVVENVSYNICDQRFHEFEIRKMNPQVRVMRRTLTEIQEQGHLGANKELVIAGQTVAVVYFRAGYEPLQYPTQTEWDARLLVERSSAIKCPSIHYHLAGTKKVQQALARPGALELFLSEPRKIEAVKEIFTGLYSLDFDEYGDLAVQMALDNPERYVLKPQREGGGNNVYGADIRDAMMKMKDSKERTAWILMERINPPLTMGYMIRPGGPAAPEKSELVDQKTIQVNKQVGHMLRTKTSTANEGGVAAGLGALDSPYLID
ncbi:Glutathione synthetase 2 [Carabus blaptoides fortunei]